LALGDGARRYIGMGHRYPFLESTCRELIERDVDLWLYCRCCGHGGLLTPDIWWQNLSWSLHGIARRSRCGACAAIGDVEVRLGSTGYGTIEREKRARAKLERQRRYWLGADDEASL
jgi:hypothetical protein